MKYKMDSWLVHLARAGDEDACEKLVKKYYSSIYQYCLLHINDFYEAEDAVFFSTKYGCTKAVKTKILAGIVTIVMIYCMGIILLITCQRLFLFI